MATTTTNRHWSRPAIGETGWGAGVQGIIDDLDAHAAFKDTAPTFAAGLAIGSSGGNTITQLETVGVVSLGSTINAGVSKELTVAMNFTPDNATATPSGDPGTGLTWAAYVSASSQVKIRISNFTTSSKTENAISWTVCGWKA